MERRRARKVGGSYQATGWIVAEFKTTAGKPRYVFEFDIPAGMLHIFGPDQVEIVAEPCRLGKGAQCDPDCKDRHQCWEPCGELGKSEEHVVVGREPTPLAFVAGRFGPFKVSEHVRKATSAEAPLDPPAVRVRELAYCSGCGGTGRNLYDIGPCGVCNGGKIVKK